MAVYACPVRKGNATITINSLDIVSGLQDNMTDDPYSLPFDKFYQRMTKGIIKGKEEYSIDYNSNEQAFDVYYSDLHFALFISPERLRAYQIGQFDQMTEQLHNLVLLSSKRDKENEIIEQIDNGSLIVTSENKDIYLSDLKKRNRKMNLAILGTSAFFSITPLSIGAAVLAPTISANPAVVELLGCGGVVVAMGAVTLDFMILTTASLRRAMADGIRNKISNRRAYKQIKRQPLLSSPANTDSLKNQQLVSINNLVYMCQPLAPELQRIYLEKINALLDEYTTEYQRIAAIKKQGQSLELMDEETAFNVSMTKKTIELELEIIEKLKKNEKVMAVIQDSDTIKKNISTLEAGETLVSLSR